ncbi:MAG: preprotein translocase subunit YajC [Chitinophagales bacterium]|nr:preprotein translocase subunit YajC [Chitinophagales bacterium]
MGDPITMLLLGGMLLVFWLFIIRPQSKQAKEQAGFQKQLAKGAKVVTSGGIHGKVVKADEDGSAVTLEIDSNTRIRIERSAISMDLTKAAYGLAEEKKEEAK